MKAYRNAPGQSHWQTGKCDNSAVFAIVLSSHLIHPHSLSASNASSTLRTTATECPMRRSIACVSAWRCQCSASFALRGFAVGVFTSIKPTRPSLDMTVRSGKPLMVPLIFIERPTAADRASFRFGGQMMPYRKKLFLIELSTCVSLACGAFGLRAAVISHAPHADSCHPCGWRKSPLA